MVLDRFIFPIVEISLYLFFFTYRVVLVLLTVLFCTVSVWYYLSMFFFSFFSVGLAWLDFFLGGGGGAACAALCYDKI